MKSRLFMGVTPIVQPEICSAERTEQRRVFHKGGKRYDFVVRDKICIEDYLMVYIKGILYAVDTGESVTVQVVPKSVKDALIKSNVIPNEV